MRKTPAFPNAGFMVDECALRTQGGCRSRDCVRLVEDGLRDGANERCGGPRVFDGWVMREASASLPCGARRLGKYGQPMLLEVVV